MSFSEQIYATSDPTSSLSQSLSDLESLHALLIDLPLRLHHEVLVPISPVGYLIGRIKHSNEVMVHLGAEWYVKRTCAQASEIIERRIEAGKPKELVLETGVEVVRTKEEALARLKLLAEEEEKGDVLQANPEKRAAEAVGEIRERVPDAPPATEVPVEQPKKTSKFMRERHPEA
jgi:prefoldin alpha subunit